MERKILIVDDDQIFNNLLSDVFKQAGYVVQSAVSADEALHLLDNPKNIFDLVVTDQRMPGTTGTEFVRKLIKTHPDLPVIMVSGFLNTGEIRGLINDGIGGIFIKPLNIFQLLKRVAQLIERRENRSKAPSGSQGEETESQEQVMQSFRGAQSATATRFLKQLESLRSFTSNLLLVGHEGTNFDSVCHDLSDARTDTVFPLKPAELDDSKTLAERIGGLATQGPGRITLVLDQVEELGPARAEAIFSLARCKEPFDKIGTTVRFIFCLRDKLDDLFNAGRIDENMYLFMGTMELNIPSLEELKEDLQAIAQSLLEDRIGADCRLEDSAATTLKDLSWPGGTRQLESVLQEAASSTSGTTISAETLHAAYEGRLSVAVVPENAEAGGLRDHLLGARRNYAEAMSLLFGGNETYTAAALGIPAASLRSFRGKPEAVPSAGNAN